MDKLRKYIKQLLENEDQRIEIGNNARQTILEKYSEQKFINHWNEFINVFAEFSDFLV